MKHWEVGETKEDDSETEPIKVKPVKVKPVKAKPVKEKKSKPAREKASRKNAGPDVGSPNGVVSLRNRRFVAGLLIRERGLEAGITEHMVKEVDSRSSKSNMRMSKNTLTDAWHIINGYVNG